MPPNSRDQFHWVNTRYGTSCRLFSIGKERKERRGKKGKKEGRKEESIWFLIFVPRRQTFGFVVVVPIFFQLFITFIYSTLRDF